MTTYVPTSETSKITQLDVRADGSGSIVYPNGETWISADQVRNMLAGADWTIAPEHDYRNTEDEHVELNRQLAFELLRAATELAASPNDIELVDRAVKAAADIERLVYGS